jgi:hypothetical protein
VIEIELERFGGSRNDEVDVVIVGQAADVQAFFSRLNRTAPRQSIDLEGHRILELETLLDVFPIDVREDGRWEMTLRTAGAQLRQWQ